MFTPKKGRSEKKEEPSEIDETSEVVSLKKISCSKHRLVPEKRPRYIRCADCGVGYILSPNSEYKKGHIYIDGQLVV